VCNIILAVTNTICRIKNSFDVVPMFHPLFIPMLNVGSNSIHYLLTTLFRSVPRGGDTLGVATRRDVGGGTWCTDEF